MSNQTYNGPFRKDMQDFISLKRTVGYKYLTEVGILKRFDTFLTQNYPYAVDLTREMVTSWCARTPHETAANQCSRSSTIRQFATYLDTLGKNAWVLPHNYYKKGQKYVPHIYTPDELRRFFAETDKCSYCYAHPYRHLIMPIFFRLLLSCGLRCSEARLLTVKDVDLENGVLAVLDSKNHNSRLVPMPDSITVRMRAYAEEVHPFPEPGQIFLPSIRRKSNYNWEYLQEFSSFSVESGHIPYR